MRLEGKRIIVTGGASGIGEAALNALVKNGANVVSIDMNDEKGREVSEKATEIGPGKASYLHGNVTNRADIFQQIDHAVELLGGLDALCCIVGTNRFTAPEDITEEEIDLLFSVNVKGVIFSNQAAFPHLRERGGAIVNFGSQAALDPGPDGAHYSASKAAVISFTRKIASEWGKYNIRANSFLPAAWTPLYDQMRATMNPEEVAMMDAQSAAIFPLGRLGDPADDIAPVLPFLVSEDAQYITGQMIVVNGGSFMAH